jgi:hypothetical protein
MNHDIKEIEARYGSKVVSYTETVDNYTKYVLNPDARSLYDCSRREASVTVSSSFELEDGRIITD